MTAEEFDEIVNETDLLQIVKWVFEMSDGNDEVRQMKDQACFLCVNMVMGSEASINEVIDPKYGVLNHVKRALENNDINDDELQNVLWLISNLVAENAIICQKVIC